MHFDNFIPNWRTQIEVLSTNVLVLVIQGSVVYSINDKQIVAEKGELIFIPQTTKRGGKNHEVGAHQKYTILFNDDDGPSEIPFMQNKEFIKYKPRNFEYMKRRFERLYHELRGDKRYRSFICLGILQELIGMIARDLENPEITPIKLQYAEIIQQYLMENYRESIEIDQLAKLIHKSPNYTISVFKEVIGQSPIQYIHQLRIIEASNLLLNSGMTIVNIADYLGYYDTSYFSRTFKKLTSMSPKEFMIHGKKMDISTIFT